MIKRLLQRLVPSKLAPSVQRRLLELTPSALLDRWCRSHPKFVIELLCHWINEKNPEPEERGLTSRKTTPLVAVAKKLSRLSTMSILYLLNQDPHLWKIYMAGAGIITFPKLPAILLELMYDLGGKEGRKKVVDVIQNTRQTIGGRIQGNLLEELRTDTVIDIFEQLPEFDVRMRLMFNKTETVAFWLDHWDLKMRRLSLPSKSSYWLGKLPGGQAFTIQRAMRELEFRRRYEPTETIYDYKEFSYKNEWKETKNSLKE